MKMCHSGGATPANRLRIRTPPDSGGSFGVKQAVFPYIVAMSLASRLAGRPVKWVEDRLEHLLGSTTPGETCIIWVTIDWPRTITESNDYKDAMPKQSNYPLH